jgi:hypothetical protein
MSDRVYNNFKEFFNDNSIHFNSGWGVEPKKDQATHSTGSTGGANSVRRTYIQSDEAGRSDKRIRDKQAN